MQALFHSLLKRIEKGPAFIKFLVCLTSLAEVIMTIGFRRDESRDLNFVSVVPNPSSKTNERFEPLQELEYEIHREIMYSPQWSAHTCYHASEKTCGLSYVEESPGIASSLSRRS